MSRAPASRLLRELLLRKASGGRLWVALFVMSVGVLMLLSAVLLWWNFHNILNGQATDESLGSSFLTLSRRVTNENMGQPGQTIFSAAAIEELRKAPEVEDLGIVRSLRPEAYMRLQVAPGMGFSTVLVLESVPDRFIDHPPIDWSWQPGSSRLPVILSSSFLSLYNYAYAPSQGLPQLSEESIRAIPFSVEVANGSGGQRFVARVVGFSNRITSVLAPESFVEYMNGEAGQSAGVSRVVAKVRDPSAPGFTQFLESHGYIANTELNRWARLRGIVDTVSIAVAVLAALLLVTSMLVFVFFIELTIARVRHSVLLLREIGYSAKSLKAFLMKHFAPLVIGVLGLAALLGILLQLVASQFGRHAGLHLAMMPGWPFWACLGGLILALLMQLRAAVSQSLRDS